MSVPKSDLRSLAEFRRHLRLFLRFSEEAATAAGISPQQHQALLAIEGFSEANGLTVGELAELLQIKHHSAVGLVDRMVAAGFAERQQATQDRRKVIVSVTAHGKQLLERLSAAHRQELRKIGPTLRDLLAQLDDASGFQAVERAMAQFAG